mgnify:CR=1 FL=1
MAEYTDTIVIGAGQAGLATSCHLSDRDIDHVILERADAVGGAGRRRHPPRAAAAIGRSRTRGPRRNLPPSSPSPRRIFCPLSLA